MLRFKSIKSALNKHKKRDEWFLDDYSVNPYEGCSCNCQYCYIRGSKYSENLEDKLTVKENLLAVLDKQLAARAKKNEYGIVVVGSATDAYIGHEKDLRLTEGILQLLLKHRFPVFISTKCNLITRDIKLLKEIDKAAILPGDLKDDLKRGVILSVSLSCLDENIAAALEPGAIPPLQRLQLVRLLKAEGFLTGVNAIPLLPYISDTETAMNEMLARVKQHEADYILIGGLTLFGKEKADSKTLYYNFLNRYQPSLIPAYDAIYGDNFYAHRQYQQQLQARAAKLCAAHGIRNTIIVKS